MNTVPTIPPEVLEAARKLSSPDPTRIDQALLREACACAEAAEAIIQWVLTKSVFLEGFGALHCSLAIVLIIPVQP